MKFFGTCPRCGGWGALWEVELMRRRFWMFGQLVPHTVLRCDECGVQPPDLTEAKNSTYFLQAAIDVQAERGKQYDAPDGTRFMVRATAAFNAITGRDLTEAEGWLLLQVLKDVRQWQNPDKFHEDSALDGVAYSSLKAEALAAGGAP